MSWWYGCRLSLTKDSKRSKKGGIFTSYPFKEVTIFEEALMFVVDNMSPLVRTCCVGEGTCHHWLGPVVWGRVHVTIG